MLTKENTVILVCGSLLLHLEAAQKKMHTDFKWIELDRDNHVEPKKMKQCIQDALNELPANFENVLVAMAYCGGSWEGITASQRVIIPNMDDCITLLLNTDDIQHANLKQMGHMYLRDSDMEQYSIKYIKKSVCQEYGMEMGTSIFGSFFQNYTNVDIIDTGVYDCYSEEFAAEAQENADLIRCPLDYVPGSNLILEKLVSGNWDEQFAVFESGSKIGKQGVYF
ncbi:MAG: DUF1638 domain-containing protein [Lachnospiraceae bacterium]|nr:DUF1638 domain-containing protein [Lachnospiraceae bacterium]MDD3617025.1 DUF1638 domain-containing protein [Lachnospiraceae bacterium]